MNTDYLQKEIDFLKMLVVRFQEQENVTDLELDLALMKTREIYEQLLKMKLLPDNAMKKAPELSVVPSVPAKQADIPEKQALESPQPEKITEKTAVSEMVKPVEQPTPEPSTPISEKQAETIIEKQAETVIEKKTVQEEEKKKPEKEITKTKADILAEQVRAAEYHPINETLAQKTPLTDLSSKWQMAPLRSIVSGIGLNDRFLFIRELFQGNEELYGKTIQSLENAASLEEALTYISVHFRWNDENETTRKFLYLIYRRHGPAPK